MSISSLFFFLLSYLDTLQLKLLMTNVNEMFSIESASGYFRFSTIIDVYKLDHGCFKPCFNGHF